MIRFILNLFRKKIEIEYPQEEPAQEEPQKILVQREGTHFYGYKNVKPPPSLIDSVIKDVIVKPFQERLKKEDIDKKFLPSSNKEEEFRKMKAREKVGDECHETLMILKYAAEIEADQTEIKRIERMVEQVEKEHNKKVQNQVESELGKSGVGKFAGNYRKRPYSLQKLIEELESRIPMLRTRIKCNREDLSKLKRQKVKREVAAGLHETYIQMKRSVRIVPFETYWEYCRKKEEEERNAGQ